MCDLRVTCAMTHMVSVAHTWCLCCPHVVSVLPTLAQLVEFRQQHKQNCTHVCLQSDTMRNMKLRMHDLCVKMEGLGMPVVRGLRNWLLDIEPMRCACAFLLLSCGAFPLYWSSTE